MKGYKNFKDKVIIITGGSSGIGLALAHQLAKLGAKIYLIARRLEKLQVAQKSILQQISQSQVDICSLDITDKIAVQNTIQKIYEKTGKIDAILNNAGFAHPGYIEELPLEIFEKSNQINYLGSLYVTKIALPYLQKNEEYLIGFTSSVCGYKGIFGYSAYSPTKFALIGFAEVLKSELSSKGATISVLCPPDTQTPQFDYENIHKPIETKALGEGAKLMTSEEVAKYYIKGIQCGKLIVLCNFESSLLYHLNRFSRRLTDWILDGIVKKARKK